MVTAAVVAWSIVALAYLARATGDGSSSGDLFVGLAALVAATATWFTAFSGWLNSRKAKENSAEAVRSLGPSNGRTVLDLLHGQEETLKEIRDHDSYSHTRNHDILSALTKIDGSTGVLLRVCERLLEVVDRLTDKLNESEDR